ncbi:MAG: NDP-sugar synthase [Chloroflexota bacterium]|nr:NDP-sugar synthase [Chloroflexota bacterium]
MLAIILAGGLGSRLLPLTENRPKSLIPVAGRPLVTYLLDQLLLAGVDHFVFAVSEATCPLLRTGIGSNYKEIPVDYSVESRALGSAGAIALATQAYKPESSFFVANGDVVTLSDLSQMLEIHHNYGNSGAQVSILLHKVPEVTHYGAVETAGLRISRFIEKPQAGDTNSNQINAGVWLFEPEILDALENGVFSRVEEDLFPRLAHGGADIIGIPDQDAYWADVGVPEMILEVSRYLMSETSPTGLIANEAMVNESALIVSSEVGSGCQIERDAYIKDSCVWNNAYVGVEARIIRSIIGEDTVIGAGAVLKDIVTGPGTVIESGARLSNMRMSSAGNHRGSGGPGSG